MLKRFPVKLFSGKTLMMNERAYRLYQKMGMVEFAEIVRKGK